MFSGEIKIPKTVKIFGLLIGISVISLGLTFDYFDKAYAADAKSEQPWNIQCASDKTIVHRFAHNDYLCIDSGTASRWVSLDMAEIVEGPEITSREQCKSGMIHMSSPWHDTTICVKRSSVPKLLSQGWISPNYEPETTIVMGKEIDEPCKAGKVVFQNKNTGAILCANQDQAFKYEGGTNFERISAEPNYDVEEPMCTDRYVVMINEENDEEFCIRVDKIRNAQNQGLVEVGESRINSGAGSDKCKGGMVHFQNPSTDVIICSKQDQYTKLTNLGWKSLDFTPGPSVTDTSEIQCKGGKAVFRNPNTGTILCSNQDQVQKLIRQGWERIDKQEKQSKEGTIQSVQDSGRGHESHQLAILLAPENTVKVGVVTYTASEPIQLVVLHGPLGPGDDVGQPIWSPDGTTKFALTFIDNERQSSGTFEFAGNALALHTMKASPFQATYSISYHSLPVGDYSEGIVDSGTMKSGPDPGIGHESHSLAILLPPSDTLYHDGVISYAASEPVQMVVLHGPLGPGEDVGQPTWTPDGTTMFGLTLVDHADKTSGSFEFTGNALAAHTMNPDGFTISYSLATRR
jgi:hypothetical protein